MAQNTDKSQPGKRRRGKGFQAASSLLASRVQKAAEGRGFAVSRMLTHWPEIAGEQLAGLTRPVRISHNRQSFGATLTLLTSGASAPMVEMQLPQLRDRINACYGYNAIQKIALTQTAASGFSEGQAQFTAAPQQPTPPDPKATETARRIAAQFDDPKLADALARLSLNLSSRTTRKDTSC